MTAKFYSVCADEGTDTANQEQLPLIIRFVDTTDEVHEEFMDFVLCDTGTSGEALAEKIEGKLQEFALDICDLRGQGYDGAYIRKV